MEYIRENVTKLSVEEIALHLNRTEAPIKRYVKENNLSAKVYSSLAPIARYKEIKESLFKEKFWETTKGQLYEEEISVFIDTWVRYTQQFAEDVLPTEQSQIRDLVMLDILQGRLLRESKLAQLSISALQEQIDDELAKEKEIRDKDLLKSHMTVIQGVRESIQTSHDKILNYQDKKSSILKTLNATRQDRVKTLKNSKVDFASLMLEFDKEDVLEREGLEMEMRREAAERARKKLGNYHQYGDNTIDRPLFNAETISRKDEEDAGK